MSRVFASCAKSLFSRGCVSRGPVSRAIPPQAAFSTSRVTRLDAQHAGAFEKIVPRGVITTLEGAANQVPPEELAGYNIDWMNKYEGHSPLVVRPKTTDQVRDIVKYCVQHKIGITPQGGNTGLVGGSVAYGTNEIVLSLSLMHQVREFDDNTGILTADAGCILQNLSDFLEPHKFIMPLDLGAKGTCQIGGNVATNAGGLRFLRYGTLHASVLGLEVVLANDNADVLIIGMPGHPESSGIAGPLLKDNTGYDLKQLFIGSEGSLGIITGVSILTPFKPESEHLAILRVDSYENVQKVYKRTRRHINEILSAFEFMDTEAFNAVLAQTGWKSPFEGDESPVEEPFYVLIETHGSNNDHDVEKLESLLEALLEDGLVETGAVAGDETEKNKIWAFREEVPSALGRWGSVYKYDLSMPMSKMYSLIESTRERIRGNPHFKAAAGYGHIADNNLHLNVVAHEYSDAARDVLEPFVYEETRHRSGSVSAEHGIGKAKVNYLPFSKGQVAIDYMHKVKSVFDPHNILVPGRVIAQ